MFQKVLELGELISLEKNYRRPPCRRMNHRTPIPTIPSCASKWFSSTLLRNCVNRHGLAHTTFRRGLWIHFSVFAGTRRLQAFGGSVSYCRVHAQEGKRGIGVAVDHVSPHKNCKNPTVCLLSGENLPLFELVDCGFKNSFRSKHVLLVFVGATLGGGSGGLSGSSCLLFGQRRTLHFFLSPAITGEGKEALWSKGGGGVVLMSSSSFPSYVLPSFRALHCFFPLPKAR